MALKLPLIFHVPEKFAFPGKQPIFCLLTAGVEVLLLLLFRLSGPFRYIEARRYFNAPNSLLCLVFRSVVSTVHEVCSNVVAGERLSEIALNFSEPGSPSNLLDSLDRLAQVTLDTLSSAVMARGAAAIAAEVGADVSNVKIVAFVDGELYFSSPEYAGTFVETERPGTGPNGEDLQRSVYSGHHAGHGMSFQGVTLPNGLFCHFSGPKTGNRNDWGVLRESGVLERFRENRILRPFQIYGDSGYYNAPNILHGRSIAEVLGWRPDLQCVRNINKCRTSVEWSFAYMKNLWAFITYPRKMRFADGVCGKVVRIAALLSNMRICLRGRCQVSDYFGTSHTIPTLDQYASGTLPL